MKNARTSIPGRLLILAIALLPVLAAAEEPRELRLASDIWPPFTDGTDRQRVAVELVETALERAGIKATTTIVEWRHVEAGIGTGPSDA